MTLKWYNIVNSQYIVIQLYMRVDNRALRGPKSLARDPRGTLVLKFDTLRALE